MSTTPRHIDSYEPILSTLRREGVDVVELLRALGVDPVAAVPRPRGAEGGRIVLALLERAVALRGTGFAARAAASLTLESLGILGLVCRSAPTVREALERGLRYRRLVFEADDFELELDGDVVSLVRRAIARAPARDFPAGAQALIELGMVGHAVALREIVGGSFEDGVELWLTGERSTAHRVEIESIAGVRVRARCLRDELRMPRTFLDRPTRHGHATFVAFFDEVACERLAAVPPDTIAGRVRVHLARELSGKPPVARDTARALGMSDRTLTRRLAAEGTSFVKMLDEVRRERALRLLSRSDVAISEIAFVLGFSDVRAFHRAFRRWTGRTPADVRRTG